MARQLRLQYPGSLWHLSSLGNRSENIYYDNSDRDFFLELLGKCVTRFDWILYAYVLLPNHFRLVIQLTAETLSRGMQWLKGRYAQTLNRQRHRRGAAIHG